MKQFSKIFELARDLRVPFDGMKQSNVGPEGGEEALRLFTEPQNVCIGR
jgi:aminomuconate-semialdehyde/2-hydroxymuconate-6-semialdehyde dehydrogenase